MVTNLRHKFNRNPKINTPKILRPQITAQPREHIEIIADISIQALSMHPELLPRTSSLGLGLKKKPKKHEDSCECDKCEYASDFQELDF